MQAAAAGPARVQRLRRTDKLNATPHPTAVDDLGLLKALPIAAAIVERAGDRVLRVTAHNDKFVQTVERTTCTATDWDEADCLKTGAIAELVQRFLDGDDPNGELEYLLRHYQRSHPRGKSLDLTLAERFVPTHDSRRRADRVIWAGLGRLPNPDQDIPTIVVEFVSKRKRDWKRDYQEKRLEYLAAGVDTVCVHGDTPDAVPIAGRVRSQLEAAGFRIAACNGQ